MQPESLARQTIDKLLRRSILKDACTGKLVPQNPADEAASALLACPRAQRKAASTR